MAKISKPDANPTVAAPLSLIWGLGHFVTNGQKQKWIKIVIAQLIGLLFCCVGSTVVGILSIIDAYKTAKKLQAGKEVDENEYSFAPLFKIVKLIHKEAILVES